MLYAFDNKQDRDDLLRLVRTARASGQLDSDLNIQQIATNDLVWLELPPDGIPARTGDTRPYKPGSADGCKVWYSKKSDDEPIQLLDSRGNQVTAKGWHYGPAAIPGTDENDEPRMVLALWGMGRLIAIVDYCAGG